MTYNLTKLRNIFKPSNRGFTLIELLVVIAIISLLASVVLVNLQGAKAKARDSIRKQDLRTIQMALELYHISYGKYPPEGHWCDSSIGTQSTSGCPVKPPQSDWGATSDLRILITEGLLGSLPKDPINNSDYYYWYEPDTEGQGTPPCPVNSCRWELCAKLEGSGTTYCVYSANR
ncbi:MAG: type II secretion system protein [Patescibacteria group bacterium]|nr:type II secretion system protein [Patescibacteria group bacterium]